LALLVAAFCLAFVIWLDRYERGELVLTEQGCLALAAHDIAPEALTDSTLCRVHAWFDFARRPDRFGTIRIEGPRGLIEIELQGRDIVSLTTQ
jgi:hypothetical protein